MSNVKIFDGTADQIENNKNKVSEITDPSSTEHYPSVKAMTDYVKASRPDVYDVWLPDVADNGDISWQKSKSDIPPKTMNIQGPAGEPGPIGPQGPEGPKGEPGAQGIQGEKGADGKDGVDGVNGKDGYTPQKGIDYYTEEEKAQFVDEVLTALPNGDEVGY